MLAVGLAENDALQTIKPFKNVAIAAINSLSAVTLSGDADELEVIAKNLEGQGIFNRFLKVDIAYHSSQMDPILDDLEATLGNIEPTSTHLPLYSTVTGELIEGTKIDAKYWCQNVRQPVRFAQGIETVIASGNYHFIEVGPHPVLKTSIKECIDKHALTGSAIITSLNRNQPETRSMYRALAALHSAGGKIRWNNFLAEQGQFIPLPTYPWQREHYWHETEISMEKRIGRAGYVYFNEKVRAPNPAWKMEVNKYLLPYLNDHQVENIVVFPGAGYIDIALALHHEHFGDYACSLENITIHKVLGVQPHQVPVLHSSVNMATNEFHIYSQDEAAFIDDWNLHASGRINSGTYRSTPPRVNVDAIKASISEELSVEAFYAGLQKRGLMYGYYFRPIRALTKTADQVLIQVQPVDEVLNSAQDYLLHPTILDASFQSLVTLLDGDQPFVPVSLERLDFYQAPRKSCWSLGRIIQRNESSIVCHIQLFDEQGNTLVEIHNLVCQAISRAAVAEEKWLYSFEWEEQKEPISYKKIDADQQILVLAKQDELSDQLVSALNSTSINYAVFYEGERYYKNGLTSVTLNPLREGDITKALALIGYMKINAVLDLWSTDVLSEADCTTATAVTHSMKLRNLAAGLQSQTQKINWLKFTRGAQSMMSEHYQQNIAIAPVLGLGPLVVNEFNNVLCRMIDLDAIPDDNDPFILLDELADEQAETEVVYRNGIRYKRRVVRHPADLETRTQVMLSPDNAIVAKPIIRKGNEEIELVETLVNKPGDKDITIAVKTVALGDDKYHLASESESHEGALFSRSQIAYECTGVVTSAGENTIWKAGDEVSVIAGKEALQTVLTIPQAYAITVPANSTAENYFSPIAYVGALYCLKTVANLVRDESVLIHGADSNLGMVAVEVALSLGATVYVSVANETNAASLKSLPVAAVFNSESGDLPDQLLALTHGKGVEVIVNSASSIAREKAFNVLAEFGRFVDLETKNNTQNRAIPLTAFSKNRRYTSVNLNAWFASHSQAVNLLLQEAVKMFTKRTAPAIRKADVFSVHDVQHAAETHSRFADSKYILIEFDEQPLAVNVEKKQTWLTTNGTFIITGGTSGFGLTIAQWLAERGAKQLVLLSRSGANSPEAKMALARIEELGAHVYVKSIDITDAQAVKQLVTSVDDAAYPLRGIFHCAGVLEDGPLVSMTAEKFSNVIKPKLDGAWNLHHATLELQHSELELFVMFSSVSSMMGNPQQANYIVANSFFDNFAYYRRARGLASTVINLGALGETGMVARNQSVQEILEEQGISGISNQYALQQLGNALEQQAVQVGILDINWNIWFRANANSKNSSRYKYLIAQLDKESDGATQNEFMQSLNAMTPHERQTSIENAVKQKISDLLRIPFDQIDSGNSLASMGVDSLVTSELSLRLKKDLSLNVNSMILLSSPSLAQLAIQLMHMNFNVEEPAETAEPV